MMDCKKEKYMSMRPPIATCNITNIIKWENVFDSKRSGDKKVPQGNLKLRSC